jgi:3-hydroxybutyryl-CoA dehydrogenase
MGAGIAQLALEAGHPVWLHDVDAAAIDRGRARIRSGLERRATRLDLDPDSADEWVDGRLARLHDAESLDVIAASAPCLVVEAALEDLGAKRAIFWALDAATPPTVILATNTSALPVGAIAAPTAHPARVIGLHFFNPAPVMPLVEVVATSVADPAVLDRATGLMTVWGKVPVRCRDTPGFIVNRVNRPFTLEALTMLAAGEATIEDIDAAMRGEGFPMGPFELMDLVGIDINLAAARGVYAGAVAAGDPAAERFRPSPIQERLVAEGRLGRKTDEGFYRYEDGRRIGPSGDFGVRLGDGATLDAGALTARIDLAVVNEAYRAVGDGVATAADIDLAMRLGANHPIGPFEQAEALGGPAAVLAALRTQGDGPRFVPAPALLA